MPQKVYGFQGSVEDLTDVTAVGKEVVQSETAADIRTAIEAAAAVHVHVITDVTGLSTQLDGKASATHQHGAADTVSGTFNEARIPTLAQSKVTNLTTDLAAKVTNASGTTMRLRGYGITAPTTGNQTGDVWFVQG